MRKIIAIDQGTTGSTVLVLSEEFDIVGRGYREFSQIYPRPGWVEHNPEDIWQSVLGALEEALRPVEGREIVAIGITNQRETSLLWQRDTLLPVRNAIVWQDRRTAERCVALQKAGHEALFRSRTGLVLDPYFSGTKLAYMLEEESFSPARIHELAFGTVDSYLVAKLTGGHAHVTDVSNASRTLLFGLESLDWDDELLSILKVPRELLPKVCSSSEIYGETRGVTGLPDGIPIAGIAGDQQAALFGQACFSPGQAKCTYGTGAFILMNTGATPVTSKHGLLTSVAWCLGNKKNREHLAYVLEGSAFIAGAAVQWLRDGLQIIDRASDVEALAEQVANSGGVMLVPAFSGLGAPHWRPEARASITGISRGTTKAHIARATLEGIALQNYDILKAMEADCQKPLTELRVDGGAAANNFLLQFQSDVLGVPLLRPERIESTALGAAFLAGLATSVWPNVNSIAHSWQEQRRFTPTSNRAEVDKKLAHWQTLIRQQYLQT